ncbi:MAG TPA: response regulator transcription factor [Oscillospiraceae bacterium]|nr:response regulator transcription factor [Oscillospiraceae bacterium]HRW57913.1 response regulator transcription factor [Oscillospiraceae bacterium]
MIFCVEDDASIRDIEVYTLKSVGFQAEGFADGTSFFEALKTRMPELVLLDVMLPGEDGTMVLRKLKANPSTSALPVIMATAKSSESNKVMSLDLGADDYLVKPFGMMEMVARVKAVLRRTAPSQDVPVLQMGGLIMNPGEHIVTADGERVLLTLKEFELLRLFLSHPGMVFTRDQLLGDIWGMDYDGETRTVDVHIRSLRKKLGACGDFIETVRGVGYRLEGNGA